MLKIFKINLEIFKKVFASFFILILAFSQLAIAQEVLYWDDCVKEAKDNHPSLVSAAEKLKQVRS